MSLVDYGNSSDDSENENSIETEHIAPVKESPKLISKKKEPVKFTVPAIDETEDDQVSVKKKVIKSSSVLLGLLPPPKYSISAGKKTSLVPHVLTKKNITAVNKIPKKVAATISSKTREKVDTPIKAVINDDENDATSCNDFFSLQFSENQTKGISLPPPKLQTIDLSSVAARSLEIVANNITNTEIHQPEKSMDFPNQPVSSDDLNHQDECQESASTSSALNISENAADNIMNDEGFLRLQGKKRGFEEINIIDVNISQELADKKEWMKSLTEEKVIHSRKKTRMPTSVQKRKHQITYLAYQAKERELDLKNQWAHNRLTKRETQAKYGF